MSKSDWVFMGHPGHFIMAHYCRFHLNTYVNGYIVSTVGELWPCRSSREIHAKVYDPAWLAANGHLKGDYFDEAYMKKFGYEDIGCDRKYETMVFKAKKDKSKCCPYRIIVNKEMDFEGYNKAEDAQAGHMRMCLKYDGRKK